MEKAQLNWIANFIWGIANDVLRDLADVVTGKLDVRAAARLLDAAEEPELLDESEALEGDADEIGGAELAGSEETVA